MASKQSQLNIGVGFQVDESGLNKAKTALESLYSMNVSQFQDLNQGLKLREAKQELASIKTTISQVETALSNAFNSKLGTTNIAQFNKELQKIGIGKISKDFARLGPEGQKAFSQVTAAALTTHTQLEKTQTTLSKIGDTLGRAIKWNIATGSLNKITGTVQEAVGYVQSLDRSLNDIQIVTNKSAESMDKFAVKANKAAKVLGTATVDYTNAALTFYQQGLGDKEVEARTDLTLKVHNVTGLDSKTAAEYVTSVLNGYKVGSEEAEHAMDKLAAVSSTTASSLAELSEGMSKVASAANQMGVSEDQLAATLSTVISVTRADAASVGTAFKTIYARISDIETGAEGAETTLGNYSAEMAKLGFNVLDSSGHLRDLGAVMEEIGGSWSNLNKEQQVSLAQTMAGTRQYSNLIALFNNWDQYQKSLNVSMKANGTLQRQQDTYYQSTAAHLEKLKAQKEDLFDSILDTGMINVVTTAFTGILRLATDFTDSIGGGLGLIALLGSKLHKLFGDTLAKDITSFMLKSQERASYTQEQISRLQTAGSLNGASNESVQLQSDLTRSYGAHIENLSAGQIKEAEDAVRLAGELKEKEIEIGQEIDKIKQKREEEKKKIKEKIDIQIQALQINKDEIAALQEELRLTQAENTANQQKRASEAAALEKLVQNRVQQNVANKINPLETKTLQTVDASAIQQGLNEDQLQVVKNVIDEIKASTIEAIDTLNDFNNISFIKFTANVQGGQERIDSAKQSIADMLQQIQGFKDSGVLSDSDTKDFEKKLTGKSKQLGDLSTGEIRSRYQDIATLFDEIIQKVTQMTDAMDDSATNAVEDAEREANAVQGLIDAIQCLEQENEQSQKDINDLQKASRKLVQDSKAEIDGLRKKMAEIPNQIDGIKQKIEQLKNLGGAQAAIKNLTKTLSGVSQAAMGITSLSSIGKIFDNQDVSTGEQILQITTSLGMGIPMLVSGFEGLVTGIKGVGANLKSLTATITMTKAAKEELAVATYLQSAAEGESAALASATALAETVKAAAVAGDAEATIILAAALGEETVAAGADQIAIDANTASKIANATAAHGDALANAELNAAMDAFKGKATLASKGSQLLTKFFSGLASKLGLGASAAAGAAVALGGVAAVAVVATVAYKGYINGLQETAKTNQKIAAAEHEKLEIIQEEKTKLDEVITSYQELNKQYNNHEISLNKLRTDTADLLKQYGFYNEILRTTTMSYEELDEAMSKLERETNTKFLEQTTKDLEASVDSVMSGAWASLSGKRRDTVRGKKALDLGHNTDLNKIDDVLQHFQIDRLGSGHIDWSQLEEVLKSDPVGFTNALKENGSATADTLLSILEEQKDWEQVLEDGANQITAAVEEINFTVEDGYDKNTHVYTTTNSDGNEKQYNLYDARQLSLATQNLAKKYQEEDPSLSNSDAYTKAQAEFVSLDDNLSKIYGLLQTFEVGGPVEDTKAKQIVEDWTGGESLQVQYRNYVYDDTDAPILNSTDTMDYEDALVEGLSSGKTFNDLIIEYADIDEEFTKYIEAVKGFTEDFSEFQPEKGVYTQELAQALVDTINTIANGEEYVHADEIQNNHKIDAINKYAGTSDANYLGSVVTGQTGLSEEQINNLFLGNKWEDKVAAAIKVAKLKYRDTWEKESAGSVNDFSTGLLDSYYSGDEIDTSTDEYKNFITQLETVKDLYPALTAEVEVLNNESAVGTKAWADCLKQVQNVMNALELNQLSKDARDANDAFDELLTELEGKSEEEIVLALNSDEFEKALDNLLQTDYAVSVEIKAEADQEFDNAFDQLDAISQAASKIGENFIVTAEDIRDVNNAFPGILENCEYLKDGTIRLNKEIANSAITAANSEAEASTEAAIEKIQAEQAVLLAKADIYDRMAKTAQMAAEDDIGLEEAISLLKGNLDELDAENDKLVTENKISNEEQVVETSGEAATAYGKNWLNAYAAVDQAAQAAAKNQKAYADAVANGGEIVSVADVLSSDEWSTQATMEKNHEAESVDDLLTMDPDKAKEALANMSQSYTAQAQGYRDAANDMSGEIATLLAKGVENIDDIDDLGKTEHDNSELLKGLDEEIDRYHDINLELEEIQDNLKDLQREEKKLMGTKYIDNLDAQIDALKANNSALSTRIKIEKQAEDEMRSYLETQGATFDADGKMTNYYDIMAEKINGVNSLIASGASKEEVQAAKDDYEKFKTKHENYDETRTKRIEDENTVEENKDKIYELEQKKFNYAVEITLDLKKAKEQWNEFETKYLTAEIDVTTPTGSILADVTTDTKNFKDFFEDSKGTAGNGSLDILTNKVNQDMAEITKMRNGGVSDIYGTDINAALEDLKSDNAELIDQYTTMEDIVRNSSDYLVQAYQEVQSSMDAIIEDYEYQNKLVETGVKLNNMLGGDKGKLDELYSQREKTDIDMISEYKADQDYWLAQMNSISDKNSKEYKEAALNYQKATSSLMESVAQAISDAQEKMANKIDKSLDDMNRAALGTSLSNANLEWEITKKNENLYLDDVNKLYELNKLQSKFTKAINDSSDVETQKKITKLMGEQMDYLKEKKNLTKYDVERAQKLLDIAVQEAALQEAQLNKSTMKLQRDTQGNYSYVYAADNDAVDEAQSKLEDMYNSLYNFDKEQYIKNMEEMFSIYQEYQEKIAEVYKNYTDENGNLTEEGTERLKIIEEGYQGYIQGLATETATTKKNLTESMSLDLDYYWNKDSETFNQVVSDELRDWGTFSDGVKSDIADDMLPYTGTAVETLVNKLIDPEVGLKGVTEGAFNSMKDALGEYGETLSTISEESGVPLDNLAGYIDTVKGNTEDYSGVLQTNKKQAKEDTEAIRDQIQKIKDLNAQYADAKIKAEQAATAANSLTTELDEQNIAAGLAATANDTVADSYDSIALALQGAIDKLIEYLAYNGQADKTPVTTPVTTPETPEKKEEKTPDAPSGSNNKYFVVDNTNKTRAGFATQGGAEQYVNTYLRSDNTMTGAMIVTSNGTPVKTYDTGGYTGEWINGSDKDNGKLAFLHQKEIVLNETDTKNLLEAVNTLRALTNNQYTSKATLTDSLLENMQNQIGQLHNKVGQELELKKANNVSNTTTDNSIQQNIVINAEFKDATSASEIEKAFISLTNRASQYAHINRR